MGPIMALTYRFRFAAHVDTKTRSGILAELADNFSAFCTAVDTEMVEVGGFRQSKAPFVLSFLRSEESAGRIRILWGDLVPIHPDGSRLVSP